MSVSIICWSICCEFCCCFWICSARLCNMASHSCLASSGPPSAARPIRLLVFLSITIFSLLEPSSLTLCIPALGPPVPSAEHYDQVARRIDALHLLGHVFLDVVSRL